MSSIRCKDVKCQDLLCNCATYNLFGVLASGVSAYKAIRSVLIIKTSEFNEYFINDLQVQWAYISIAIK